MWRILEGSVGDNGATIGVSLLSQGELCRWNEGRIMTT